MARLNIQYSLKQRLVALLACASILFTAMMPAISQAMMNEQTPPGMIKVCSSTGTKFIPDSFASARANSAKTFDALAVGNSSNQSTQSKAASACGTCEKHAGTYSILTNFDYNFSPSDLSTQYHQSFYTAPISYSPLSSHSPRGPPQSL